MPVLTRIAGYSVGSDVSFAIMDDYGNVFSDDMMGLLTQFDLRSNDVKMKVTPISNGGVPIHQTIPNGVSGTLTFVRTGPSFNQMHIELADAYYLYGTIPQFAISMNIRNRNSTVDQYLIPGVQFSNWRFGDFRGTKEVDLQLAFDASRLSGSGSLATFLNNLS